MKREYELKHTKGNWSLDVGIYRSGIDTYLPIKSDIPKRDWICESKGSHVNNGISTEEMEANAKLIAAAPDLLMALQYYFEVLEEVRGENWDENPDHVMTKMLNAYKKATD